MTHSEQHLPITSKPFVSAVSDHGATISGPPSTLRNMQNDPILAKFTAVRLPLKAPYHAPHLFSDGDVDSILSTTFAASRASQLAVISPISSSTGENIWASNFKSLLAIAVEDILLKPIR